MAEEIKKEDSKDTIKKEDSKDTIKITPQDLMDKLTSLAETMVNLQTQIDGIKVKEKQVESVKRSEEKEQKKEEVISSEEAWESLFK